jgi:hypothetical protein
VPKLTTLKKCWLCLNMSTIHKIFCVHLTCHKKWKHYMALYHYLCFTFHDNPWSGYVKVLYNILTEFITFIKLIWINKMFLNETHWKIMIGK